MDANVIKIRRGEVDRHIERLKAELDALTAELRELEIAERVFNRLTGAERNTSGKVAESKPSPPKPAVTKKGVMTVRQMVFEALMDARQRGLPGRTPNEIREYLLAHHKMKIGQPINTTASRMWRDLKEINKDEAGRFSLPEKESAADLLSVGDGPAAVVPNVPSRDAQQGGGT
ncbi:MAG TPA: hypothetical protein VMF90_16755 [Rhizobiaceae bacterium]|nr:hypothetical protein [Rhizobiaceae bacterium]